MRFQQGVEEAIVLNLRHWAVDVVGCALVVASGHVHALSIDGVRLHDGADRVIEIKLIAAAQAQDLCGQRVGGQGSTRDDSDSVVLVDVGDFLAHYANQRLALDGVRYGHREIFAIDRQRVPGGNRGLRGDVHQQGTGAAHLFFQQPRRGVLAIGFQRVGANKFGEMGGLVRGSLPDRSHLVEVDGDAAARALPRGL